MIRKGADQMKKREVNFELLRILCMYMIVIGHCLFHGRVTAKLGYGTVNYFLDYLIQSFSVVHVNCFVMLAGYFAIDRGFQCERLLKLWRQILFYAISIWGVCVLFGSRFGISVEWMDLVRAVLPISSKNYWFASVYFALMLVMPFAGMLVKQLSRKQYQFLLVILAVVMSLNHMVFRVNVYGNYAGRELGWFLFLTLFAGYLKQYTKKDSKYVRYGLAGYILCSLCVLGSIYLSVQLGWEDMGYFLNYNSPFALGATISLFLCVKNISWKETKVDPLILKLAGAAFGVYLIHDNYLIRYLVWDSFRVSKVALTHWSVIYAGVVSLIVYSVCTILELFRQKMFAICRVRYEKTALYQKEKIICQKLDGLW